MLNFGPKHVPIMWKIIENLAKLIENPPKIIQKRTRINQNASLAHFRRQIAPRSAPRGSAWETVPVFYPTASPRQHHLLKKLVLKTGIENSNRI